MEQQGSWISKQGFQSVVAFCISTLVHMAIVLALAMIIVASQGNGDNAFNFAMVAQDAYEEMTELDVELQSLTEPTDTEESSITLPSISSNLDLTAMLTPSDLNSNGSSDSDVSDQVAFASAKGQSAEKAKDGLQSSGSASFFGAKAEGNRFVFVIDSSGSMRGPRWQALCKELVRAIKSLSPDQEFFVISFDSVHHPMFGTAPPRGKFLHPTSKNVERIQNWLRSIRHGSQTYPASAVGMAMQLEPDGVFLLSDGEINDSTVSDLRIWNRKTDEQGYDRVLVPIHTVLLHSDAGYATLETIANENAGTFTPVVAN